MAIELGSSKVVGIAGRKNMDGSISVLAVAKEPSSAFIRKGMVYNIDKTAQCLSDIVGQLERKLKRKITQVYVGVGGQSIRSVRNNVALDLPQDTKVTQKMVDDMQTYYEIAQQKSSFSEDELNRIISEEREPQRA